MIINMRHMRKAKMCSRGARDFFIKNNLDWDLFLKSGIDESEFIKTGDAMALKLVEVAHGK